MIKYFTIAPDKRYKGQVSWLVTFLQMVRANTFKIVAGLTKAELDQHITGHNNSIGTLLKHIVAMEYQTQCITFLQRELNEEEKTKWKDALAGGMWEKPIRNKPPSWYIRQLAEIRKQTLKCLLNKDGRWLKGEAGPYKNTDNYFMWFHLMEDEIAHQGQIKAMKTLLRR